MGHCQPRKLSKYGQERKAEKGRGVVQLSTHQGHPWDQQEMGEVLWVACSPGSGAGGLCSASHCSSSPLLVGPQYLNLSRGPSDESVIALGSKVGKVMMETPAIHFCSACFLPGCPSCEFHLLPINQIPGKDIKSRQEATLGQRPEIENLPLGCHGPSRS